MSKFCFLLLTFCAQLWPILCIMFLSFRKDQPCGAWAFCMFFCWHVTQPPNDYSSMAQPFQEPRHLPTHVLVDLPVFSILICGICQDAVSPTWPEAEVVHAVRTFLYWFNCHFSRETWVQQVCKIETNFGATPLFMQNCQSATGAPGQFLNRTRVLFCKHAQRTTMPASVIIC